MGCKLLYHRGDSPMGTPSAVVIGFPEDVLEALTYVISRVVYYFIEAIEFAMLARAILSWIPLDDDNPIDDFITAITEPFIYPVRVLLERFDAFQNSPIDVSFFITYIILIIISSLLSAYGGF